MNTTLSLHNVAAEDWPQICARFGDLTHEQTLAYSQPAAIRIGASVQYVVLHNDDGDIVAAAAIRTKTLPIIGRGISWIASGPMLQWTDGSVPTTGVFQKCLDALQGHARQQGNILRLRLPITLPTKALHAADLTAKAGFTRTAKAPAYNTILIDCSPSEVELMKSLHGKWRNPLRNALKAGLKLDVLSFCDAYDRFERMYLEVQETKGFLPDVPPSFYRALNGPDFDHDVLIARKDGKDVAGMTVGRCGTNAIYLFGATPQDGRKLNAGHYLMWQAMLHCKKQGIRWFDLGGVDQDDNPTVARFKQRTGGVIATAAGPFEYRPPSPLTPIILLAEKTYTRLKKR